MIRVIKPEGFGNIQLEDVPIPEIESRQVLVRTHTTLISRGSELFRRYIREDAVSPTIMGYSLTGTVEKIGRDVTEFDVGQRVKVVAPHAQYAVGDADSTRGHIVPLPDDVSFEEGTFLLLCSQATAWTASSGIKKGDTVVILGQGVVGSLMMQIMRGYEPARIITVDALPLRCKISKELGADIVINASDEDPVESVLRLTNGKRADLVVDCVGGYAGIHSFEQAQEMVRTKGTIQLVAAYQQAPLPLHSGKIMHKRLIAGDVTDVPPTQRAIQALEKIRTGEIQPAKMITHRFPFKQAKEAFDFLWNTPEEALAVLLTWR